MESCRPFSYVQHPSFHPTAKQTAVCLINTRSVGTSRADWASSWRMAARFRKPAAFHASVIVLMASVFGKAAQGIRPKGTCFVTSSSEQNCGVWRCWYAIREEDKARGGLQAVLSLGRFHSFSESCFHLCEVRLLRVYLINYHED